MKKIFHTFLLFCIVGIFTISVTSCCKITGGGWIPSLHDKNSKATFGLNIKVTDKDGNYEVKGQVQYNDHGAGIKFHGTATEASFFQINEACLGYVKGYTKDGYDFIIVLIDEGEHGVIETGVDSIAVSVSALNYYNLGVLGGGNIQLHQ